MTKEQEEKLVRAMYGDPHDGIPYFAALGKFIVEYARAETGVQLLTRKLSGLNEERGRIIFGGMRLTDIFERLRKLMPLEGIDKKSIASVESCLVHLDAIGKQRDKMAHRIVSYHKGYLHVTNAFTAKAEKNAENDKFSLTELQDMESDCTRIHVRLEVIRRPYILGKANPEQLRILHSAWRYKPPKQGKRNHESHTHKHSKSRSPQPPSSQK